MPKVVNMFEVILCASFNYFYKHSIGVMKDESV